MDRKLPHCLLHVIELSTNDEQRDGTEKYIQWAHSKNFGIMDINVPRYNLVGSADQSMSWLIVANQVNLGLGAFCAKWR